MTYNGHTLREVQRRLRGLRPALPITEGAGRYLTIKEIIANIPHMIGSEKAFINSIINSLVTTHEGREK
jgi:hypothetical protein